MKSRTTNRAKDEERRLKEKTPPHVCPPHEHDYRTCDFCVGEWNKGYDWAHKHRGEKIVYRWPLWGQALTISSLATLLFWAAIWGDSQRAKREVVHDGGYPVVIRDEQAKQRYQGLLDACNATLDEARADYRADQVTKKLLRMKLKRLELPLE